MSKTTEIVRKVIIVSCACVILLICLACAGVAFLIYSSDNDDSQEIWRVALASTDGQLRLADAVSGKWDQVYVFGPYVQRSTVCGTLGVAANQCERIVPFESSDDGEMSLAFVADRQVVRYFRHNSKNGDFSPVATGLPVLRAKAVFRIVPGSPQYNGRRSLTFVALP